MKSKENIDHLVEETLESASGIGAVKTPPFFKDKVLNKIAQSHKEEEVGVPYLNWLAPTYQAALLIAIIILNTVVLVSNTKESSYVEHVEDFSEMYGLSESDTDSYFYQN